MGLLSLFPILMLFCYYLELFGVFYVSFLLMSYNFLEVVVLVVHFIYFSSLVICVFV